MAKIMLVEDDNNLREIYEARLQAEGYTIISAKDGEEALVLAKAEKPDLIISDIMMPKISGFEMLDILRNTDGLKEVKVIMLTALGQNDDQQRADRLGADRYLVKSQVTLEDIVKAAHQLLNDEAAPAPAAEAAPTPAAASPPNPEPATPVAAATPVATAIPVVTEPTTDATPAPSAPVATPSEPVADPASTPPVTPAAGDTTQSTVQEEAGVESKIEDFVAGATEEATPPTPPQAAASPDDATTIAPAVSSEPPAASADAATAKDDDKLVSDAVETLVASTETVAPDPPPAAADPEPEAAPEPESLPKPKAPAESGSKTGSVPIAHKKVIEPLDGEPKKDLDVLLAIEAANEASTVTPPPPAAVIATNDLGIQPTPTPTPQGVAAAPPTISAAVSTTEPSTAPPPAPKDSTVDPSSIAL
jgi:CheY-like chemotaxis protein